MSQKTFDYKPHVDGLRAVAVLLVVLYHVGVPGPRGGFVGVDVFFVISGYLITSLLFLEAQQGRVSLAAFYARRVRRLFPAMLVVVAATLLLGAIFLLPIFSEQTGLARSAVATAVYLSNFYFWRYTGDYFGASTTFEPLLHTWSLAVEEQFYLVWPFLIIGLLKLGIRQNLRRDLLALLVALSGVSFVLSLWGTRAQPDAAFYLMPFRAWQFGVGGIVAILLADRGAGRTVLGGALSIAGLAAIIVGGVTLREQGFPGWGALLPTLGAAAVIAGGQLAPTNAAAALLAWQPVRFVGLVSYSWYLWHWPLLAIARAASVDLHDLRRDAAIGIVSFVLAVLTYYIVENPVRYKRPGPFKTSVGTLAAGVTISVVLAAASVALGLSAKRAAATDGRYAALERARADVPVYRATRHLPMSDEFPGLPEQKRCVFGNADNIGAVLWGDSHADHLSGLMAAFSKEHGDRGILQRSYSSCRSYGEDTLSKSDAEIQGVRGLQRRRGGRDLRASQARNDRRHRVDDVELGFQGQLGSEGGVRQHVARVLCGRRCVDRRSCLQARGRRPPRAHRWPVPAHAARRAAMPREAQRARMLWHPGAPWSGSVACRWACFEMSRRATVRSFASGTRSIRYATRSVVPRCGTTSSCSPTPCISRPRAGRHCSRVRATR